MLIICKNIFQIHILYHHMMTVLIESDSNSKNTKYFERSPFDQNNTNI